MTRFARQYVLLHPDDCDPPHGLDMHPGSRDWLKVEHLKQSFAQWGFSQRWTLKLRLASWKRRGVPTLGTRSSATSRSKNLELVLVKESGTPPGLDERVDLNEIEGAV